MRAALVRVWRRLTCGRLHGEIVIGPNQIWIECARCGFVSPGIALDSEPIGRAWRYDSQRARFRQAS
jgi:hypothetical protein